MSVPFFVFPIAPAGEQNAPGVTGFSTGRVVAGGFAVVAGGGFGRVVVGAGFVVEGEMGVRGKGGGGAVPWAVDSSWDGHVAKTRAMAACSAGVTQRWYCIFTATWRATYEQRKALLGGSQLAASASPLLSLAVPDTANSSKGSFAKLVRTFKVSF